MASSAQIIANQANAKLSTGPKTADGKTRSSKNALKNGFHSVPALAPEDKERFLQFEANLRASIETEGALEETAFLQLLDAAWRLHQLRRDVAALFAEQTQTDPLQAENFEAIANQANRARAAAEMQFYRAIQVLEELQTNRLGRYLHLTEEEFDQTAVCSSPKSFTYRIFDGIRLNRADRDYIGALELEPPLNLNQHVLDHVAMHIGEAPL